MYFYNRVQGTFQDKPKTDLSAPGIFNLTSLDRKNIQKEEQYNIKR